jgi:hypothetical protein
MRKMISASRLFLLVTFALAVLGCATVAQAQKGTARQSATCHLGKDGRRLGATYVTSLSVSRVSCSTGKRVVKAYNACRRAHGGVKGKCPRKVLGYRCSEHRDSIPTEITARVSCKASARRVRFNYEQFT